MTNPEDESITIDSVVLSALEKFLIKHGIQNYKISGKKGSNIGDNYLGVIIRTKVTGQDKNGENIVKNLIIKCAHTSEGYRKNDFLEFSYHHEINVYSELLPFYKKFQEQRNILKPFSSYPTCYAFTTEQLHESLIMEDMAVHGYVMKDRQKSLNTFHCKLVVKELGKLHALSLAFKDQEPGVFEKNLIRNSGRFPERELLEGLVNNNIKELSNFFDPVKQTDLLNKYTDVTTSIIDDLYRLMPLEETEGYAVILHGDCWINNMLFKYEDPDDTERPSKICFLDWQISRIGSPVIDLFYFIYTSTDQEFRNKYFEEVIGEYYNSLSEFLRELGSNPEIVFPERILREQMKKFAKCALVLIIMVVPLMTAHSENIPNTVEETATGKDVVEVMSELKISEYSLKRLQDCFIHMCENKFL